MTAMATQSVPRQWTDVPDQKSPTNWQESEFLPPGWNKKRLGRLFDMIESSTRGMSEFRRKWVDLVEYSVGRHYNGGGKRFARPKNDIHAFRQAYVYRCCGEIPRCQVWPRNMSLRPQAYNVAVDTNRTLENMQHLEEFQERAVGGAFFGLSMAKVCTTFTDDEVTIGEETFRRQEVKISLVDTEDAILDIAVKSTEDMRFIGNRYLRAVEDVLKDEDADPQARAYISRMKGSGRHESPVPWEEQPLRVAGITQNQVDEDSEDQVQLMDVYLPQEHWLLTLVVGAPNIPPLYGRQWHGCDPYIPLVYEYVDGNVLPMPPARHWMDVCASVDNALAKLLNQLRRQKTIGIVRGGQASDKTRIDQTPDGGACFISSQYGVEEVNYGGPNAVAQAFTIQLQQLSSDIAGNINAIVGLDVGADSATEASMMAAGSNGTLDAYRNKIRKWWAKIQQAVAWFKYHDALHNPSSQIERGDPRVGIAIYGNGPGHEHEGWTFEDRQEFNFFDFMFDVVPATNVYKDPEKKAAAIARILATIFGQFGPLAMQQGVTLDVAKYVRQTAELSNLEPEIKELIMRTEIPEVPIAPGQDSMVATGKPNGKYVHQSRPSTVTRRGSDMQAVSDLMSMARASKRPGAMQGASA